jgi:hypothetical protein
VQAVQRTLGRFLVPLNAATHEAAMGARRVGGGQRERHHFWARRNAALRSMLKPHKPGLRAIISPRSCSLASARAYVGFVRANVAEYDITEVCHRSRGRPVIRCPILA